MCMKKILSSLILSAMFFSSSFAIYNPDAPVVSDEDSNGVMLMTATTNESSIDTDAYENYIRENISTLSPVLPVLGGTWYVTNITWWENGYVTVEYEDGHIAEVLTLDVSTLDIVSSEDENRMCTLQYAPVCAQVQVQCIRAPCPPIEQTFWNACSAWENPILYTWECSEYINADTLKKYEEKSSFIDGVISNIPVKTLQRLSEKLNTLIENTKLLKIIFELQKERITKYFFIKQMIDKEVMKRI